jgi:DNA-binding LytR/AlgR family response regulator
MNFYTLDEWWRVVCANVNDARHRDRIMPGKNIWEEYPGAAETPLYQACLQARDQQQSSCVEIYHSPDNSWWETTIFPHASGVAVYFREITEAKKVENERQKNLTDANKKFSIVNERLEQLLENIKPGAAGQNKLALPTADGLAFIRIADIIYCKAAGNYTEIYLKDGKKYLVSRQLKEYEDMLKEYNFFRIHHSSLIHLDYIQSYVKGDGGYVVMSDNTSLDVSRRKKESFLERMGYRA